MSLRSFDIRRSFAASRRTRSPGQGLVEFALILPLLLLLLLGIMEVGRMLVIYSSLSSAAKQAARYGSVAGDSDALVSGEQSFYLDCAGMKETALRTSILVGLDTDDIGIAYDRGTTAEPIGRCPLGAATPVLSETIKDGYRVIISITTIYRLWARPIRRDLTQTWPSPSRACRLSCHPMAGSRIGSRRPTTAQAAPSPTVLLSPTRCRPVWR
jgi:hypothetical protein